MVTLVLLTVNAVLVLGVNEKAFELLAYEMSSCELSLYVAVITNPVGAKYSPAVYVVFVGAVLIAIVLNVFAVEESTL